MPHSSAGVMDDEVSRWLAALPDNMHRRLVAVGLAKPRAMSPMTARRHDPGAIPGRIHAIPRGREAGHAADLRPDLSVPSWSTSAPTSACRRSARATPTHGGCICSARGLPISTVNRACGMARQFFRAAVRRKLLDEQSLRGPGKLRQEQQGPRVLREP